MSEKEVEKWAVEGRSKDLHMSPSCSSFAVLDTHDPVLSRIATHLFKCTYDCLQGETIVGQEHYLLIEELNRHVITKYADLRSLAVNFCKTNNEHNDKYECVIKRFLQLIDDIDAQVSQLEGFAYQIDNYTKQLKERFMELRQKDSNTCLK